MTAYNTGTITLAQGSKSIIGTDTGWQTAIIAAGVIYVQAEGGNALPFDTVVSDTEISAAIEWTGPSGTYDYALVRETTNGTQQIATATALSQHVQRLANAAIAAIAGVTPEADKLLLFTGPSTATLVNRNDFLQGVDYDETVADLAGLAIYDGEDEGFSVLVIDAGDNRSAILIKKSAAVADWYDPAFITPEQGIQGNPGGFTTITFEPVETLLPGADVTMTITNTGPGAISLKFGIPVGVPGDMEGPDGATDGMFAAFDGPSGKKLKQQIITALLTTFDNSVAGLKDNPTTVQAAIDALATSPAGGVNDALFALEIADLKGVRQGMVGGVADAFDDETGVGSSSSGQQYNAASDYYSPVKPDAVSTVVSGTIDSSSTFTIFVRSFTLVNGGRVRSVGVHSSIARSYTVKIGRRVSVGVYDILTDYTFNHPGGGWFDHVLPEPYVLPATGSLLLGVVQPLMNGASASPTVLRAWKTGDVSGSGQTGFNEDTATVSPSVRLEYLVTTSMSLVSVAYAAAAQPSSGRVAVQVSGNEAIVPNADLFADMSRDGGTTWSTGVLSLSMSFSGMRMFEASDIDLSSQPAGSSVRWRVRTANDKVIQVSGVSAQWKD